MKKQLYVLIKKQIRNNAMLIYLFMWLAVIVYLKMKQQEKL